MSSLDQSVERCRTDKKGGSTDKYRGDKDIEFERCSSISSPTAALRRENLTCVRGNANPGDQSDANLSRNGLQSR